MPRSPNPPTPPEPERAGTLMESPEDIRRALQSKKAAQPPALVPAAPATAPAAPAAAPQPPPSPSAPAARPYRPTFRPPVALLTICDDGKSDGEIVRIRTDHFVIGRTEGDFLIPHDGLISGQHAEITRQRVGEGYRWVVTDLQTKNGLFVRVSRTAIVDKAEFLVGRGPAATPPVRFAGPATPSSSRTTSGSTAKPTAPGTPRTTSRPTACGSR